jgi:hypothetical protein
MSARTLVGMAGACALLSVACESPDYTVPETVTGAEKVAQPTPVPPPSMPTPSMDAGPSDCSGGRRPRNCASHADNDCDGLPDDTLDDVCRCLPGMREPCNGHGEKDGNGPCQAGERVCVATAGGSRSDWGPCTGEIAPKPKDSCTVPGDDSDCDGTPNGDCPCISGETRECGPPEEVGICQFGVSTCQGERFSTCQGAVTKQTRNCASSEDNDCDGKPDNTVDTSCTCEVGTSRACGTHSNDGVGICRAGTQTCVASANGSTSAYGPCTGSVGPSTRSCSSSRDNDCDGSPDNAQNGTQCRTGGTGICAQGSMVCSGGALSCVATAPRAEVCNGVDDDCDGQVDETCISVVTARIGCLDIQIAGNLTDIVAQACDGRTTCSYQAPTPAEYQALGVQAATRAFCTQAMEIIYQCGNDGVTAFVPGDAFNNPPAQLSCASF